MEFAARQGHVTSLEEAVGLATLVAGVGSRKLPSSLPALAPASCLPPPASFLLPVQVWGWRV
jgi:hypothetical protein